MQNNTWNVLKQASVPSPYWEQRNIYSQRLEVPPWSSNCCWEKWFRCSSHFRQFHFLFYRWSQKKWPPLWWLSSHAECCTTLSEPLCAAVKAMNSTASSVLACFKHLLPCDPEGPKTATRRSILIPTRLTSASPRFRSRSWGRVWGAAGPWELNRTSQTCTTVSGWVERTYVACVIRYNADWVFTTHPASPDFPCVVEFVLSAFTDADIFCPCSTDKTAPYFCSVRQSLDKIARHHGRRLENQKVSFKADVHNTKGREKRPCSDNLRTIKLQLVWTRIMWGHSCR